MEAYDPAESIHLNGLVPNADKKSTELQKSETKWTFWLLTVGIATTFGAAVPTGYNIGVINAPANIIKKWCNVTIAETYGTLLTHDELDTFWAVVVSIFLIGGVIGSLGGAWVADKFGRKKAYLICGVLLIMSGMCFQFCRGTSSVELLLLGRILAGLAAGLTTSTVPMYLTELAPIDLRGSLGVFCSMGVTGGVVVGQLMSLEETFGTDQLWQFSLSLYVILVITCLIPYHWLPESPRYLYVMKHKKDEAFNEIKKLSGKFAKEEHIKQQIEAMKKQDSKTDITEDNETPQTTQRKLTLWSVLTDPSMTLPLILVCALQGGQQLSGINAVFFYSVSIFESVGISSKQAKFANLGAGCLNLFVALFTPILMEKFNRRVLAQLSCSMCAVFLFILAISVYCNEFVNWFGHISIVALLCYILFYQIGLGPIPYFIGSELFEVGPRPAAMAMGSITSWGCNFIVAMLFTYLQNAWGAFVFLPFTVTCVLLMILINKYLPETRGRHISSIIPQVSNGFRSKPLLPLS